MDKLSIKQLAAEDRPREKMLLKGISALSDAELLALLIGSGNVQETAVQLSQRILNSVGNNLNTLGKLTVKDLMSFNGIGSAKAITIAAALELGRRRKASDPAERPTIRCSKDAFEYFYPLLGDLPHEELWVALINTSARVIEKVQISKGGVGDTSADLRFILKAAITNTCHGIVLCHNHPSGSVKPSASDDALTQRLKSAAALLNIILVAHIIICDKNYYSYADEGKL